MSKDLGSFLRKIRKSRGMTLREVEVATAISNSYLSQIEQGKKGVPSLCLLHKLSQAYGFPMKKIADAGLAAMGGGPLKVDLELKQFKKLKQNPDVKFIIKRYSQLSEKGKEQLMNYLNFLIKEEKKGK